MRKTVKRENGTGSIFKRPNAKRRKWAVLAPATYDDEGKAHRQSLGSYATLAEAKEVLEQFNKHPTVKFNMTFAECYEEWSSVHYKNVSKTSVASYESAYKKLTPLYDLKIKEIKTSELQRLIDEYSNQSKASLNNMRIIMANCFQYAVQNDIAQKNYAQFVVLPKKEQAKKESLTDLEIQKLLDLSATDHIAKILVCLIYTGFRINELLTMTKDNYFPDQQLLVGGSKTKAGKNRTMPLHPKIQTIVNEFYNMNGETLFCDTDGKAYIYKTFTNQMKTYCSEKINNQITAHQCRHTFATLLSRSGARTEDIMKLMGHSSFSVTADTYIHQDIETLRNALKKIS